MRFVKEMGILDVLKNSELLTGSRIIGQLFAYIAAHFLKERGVAGEVSLMIWPLQNPDMSLLTSYGMRWTENHLEIVVGNLGRNWSQSSNGLNELFWDVSFVGYAIIFWYRYFKFVNKFSKNSTTSLFIKTWT